MKKDNNIREKIENLLIKWGNNPKEVKEMVDKHFDYVMKTYPDARAGKKAEIIRIIY